MNLAHNATHDIVSAAYAQWKRYGHHLEEYASELLGTAFLAFCVVSAVAIMFAARSPVPRWIPSESLRLLLTGLLLGGAGWLVAISGPGKLSGAHINPAVSLGFWLLGKMHARDAACYMLSQMIGALAGALLAQRVLGDWAAQVADAALKPGASVTPLWAFAGETGATFTLLFVIFTCVSHKPLLRWTPAIATGVVGLLVWADGQISGAGMNPARWFGPAWATGTWRLAWVYVAGPLIGALAAALLRRSGAAGRHLPHTAKRYHDPRYRSIFLHDHVPTAPPGTAASGSNGNGSQQP